MSTRRELVHYLEARWIISKIHFSSTSFWANRKLRNLGKFISPRLHQCRMISFFLCCCFFSGFQLPSKEKRFGCETATKKNDCKKWDFAIFQPNEDSRRSTHRRLFLHASCDFPLFGTCFCNANNVPSSNQNGQTRSFFCFACGAIQERFCGSIYYSSSTCEETKVHAPSTRRK